MNARVYVHHNESPVQTFHPKVYVFRNQSNATVLIGSNNISSNMQRISFDDHSAYIRGSYILAPPRHS